MKKSHWLNLQMSTFMQCWIEGFFKKWDLFLHQLTEETYYFTIKAHSKLHVVINMYKFTELWKYTSYLNKNIFCFMKTLKKSSKYTLKVPNLDHQKALLKRLLFIWQSFLHARIIFSFKGKLKRILGIIGNYCDVFGVFQVKFNVRN